ncbi:acetylxylan esterase [Vagococcus fessus]|uniref:Acetylxylan esterase n=1 Tax=Vagococcus fessus TaxID=120370 RepID=A0A430A8E8_9ENTE|nr:acetylxylan esterase [Vagococcus fessus]RSU03334.1 acetylxylan esterase [Vagococcus fessus]
MLDSMDYLDMKKYKGKDEPPSNFKIFWEERLKEVNSLELSYNMVLRGMNIPFAECYDLTYKSIDDSDIYSKVIIPKQREKCPVMFKFHGYQGRSSDWSEVFKFAASGVAVVMMDVRGQAGKSNDCGHYKGNTVKGHIVRGLPGDPEGLFYTKVYQDIALLIRIISECNKIDTSNMMSYGESQGGALALVAAALQPKIKKVFATYPFLSDFRRVLDLKYDTEAYDELHRYFKFVDPFYDNEENVFKKLGYIDVKNFASDINAEVMMVCGLLDDVCPPSTQYAIYNRLNANKKMLVLPEYGHESMNVTYQDMVFDWATGSNITGHN